jgi:site-specific DNA recombinase
MLFPKGVKMEQMGINQTANSYATIYCHLSKDDDQAGESVSIQTQKMMLEKYCHEQGFAIYDVYADDGYSGLNFNRPEFNRLLTDIDNGKVNLVITKDLSRLGRDYIQTGYYNIVLFYKIGKSKSN